VDDRSQWLGPKAVSDRIRRPHQKVPFGGAGLSYAVRGSMVNGRALDRISISKIYGVLPASTIGQICTIYLLLSAQEAVGQRERGYPWPYYEGLRLDEASNELALMTTGIYGEPLPKQHGAPMRLIIPWKYGYKSPKSIVKIEFIGEQPRTFWNDLAPTEYSFFSNVDPDVPQTRWSQATELDIGTGLRIPTLKYNGYTEFVGSLYA